MTIPLGVACAACAIGVYFDVRVRRIPNWLTLSLIAFALFAAFATGGGTAFLRTLVLVVASMCAGALLHRTGWLGGGDIKLAVGLCAVLGYPRLVTFLFATAIAGGVLALVVALARGRTSGLLRQLRSAIVAPMAGDASGIVPVSAAPMDARLPYAIAIAGGLAAAILLSTFDPTRFGA